MSLFKRLKGKIPPRLHDLLWPRDLKARLFAWTCVGIALIIVAFFVSEEVALFLYDYSFGIALGSSFGKVTMLLVWLLYSFLIANISIRRKWRPFHFRRLFIIFLILVALLSLANILVFRAVLDNAGGSELEALEGELEGRPVIVGFRPEAIVNYSSSTLEHTHSLKPVLYWFFNHFTDADAINYDVGAALYPLYPAPWLVYPAVLALLVAYLLVCITILAHTANEEKKSYIAWFNCLIFSLASFSFFVAILDGGPFTTISQMSIALLSLYLLMRYVNKKQGKKRTLSLIFLPLVILAALNFVAYNLAPRVISLHEHFLVTNLCLAAAGFYEFKHRGAKSILLALILFLLVFNISSFRPYSEIRESYEGGNVFMILSIDSSISDNEVLGHLNSIPGLAGPEILARDAKTVVAKASTERAGISSQNLAYLVTGRRMVPLESNIRFRFGNPLSSLFYSIYFPVEEVELRQVLPAHNSVRINSLTELSRSLVKVDYDVPEGLNGGHYLMLVLSQRGMRLTRYIYMRPFTERDAITQARDFLRTLLPVTHLQPVITTIFP